MTDVIAAVDQGTTSTRCLLIDHQGRVVASAQAEHQQHFPRPGWVEHDAGQLWTNTCQVADDALRRAGLRAVDVAALGIANQRETTVIWDRGTGEPVAPAIGWQDTRTRRLCESVGEPDRYRERTGLPLSTYFSGPKIAWILDEYGPSGDLAFGTVDSWLLWKLTDSAVHATDATNASRTLLMDLDTLTWLPEVAAELGVPSSMLPEIHTSSEVYGTVTAEPLAGVPITGILGDQQAAAFGQACLSPGDTKCTYGTGNFVLLNTGTQRVRSEHGLLATVGYTLPGIAPRYALEGSIAVTGALVQWLRDNLGIVSGADEIEALARTVTDNGGAYLVPAFSGLFAPRWRPDARGALVGLTGYVNRGHLARAVLEATAYQTREVIEAMNADCGHRLRCLKVDGGMVVNDLLMQFQSDLLDVPVVRPRVRETTALGAAYAAGLAVGFWSSIDEIAANWQADCEWHPRMPADDRERLYADWCKAVTRTYGWAS